MKIKSFLGTIAIISALSGGLFSYLYYMQDPRSSSFVVALFMTAVFILVSALSTALFYLPRVITGNREMMPRKAKNSIREGVLCGVYSVMIMTLATIKLLTWWDSFLLALSLVLFEIYFLSGREKTI